MPLRPKPEPDRARKILVILPDGPQRDAVLSRFRARGFRVIEAHNADEAFELFRAHRSRIRAVAVNPDTKLGSDTLHLIRRINPEVRPVRIPPVTSDPFGRRRSSHFSPGADGMQPNPL